MVFKEGEIDFKILTINILESSGGYKSQLKFSISINLGTVRYKLAR